MANIKLNGQRKMKHTNENIAANIYDYSTRDLLFDIRIGVILAIHNFLSLVATSYFYFLNLPPTFSSGIHLKTLFTLLVNLIYLAFSITSVCQIYQTYFSHYMFEKFRLRLSDFMQVFIYIFLIPTELFACSFYSILCILL